MFRYSNSVLLNAALVLSTVVSLPTALHAEPKPPSDRDLQSQTQKKAQQVPVKDSRQTVAPSAADPIGSLAPVKDSKATTQPNSTTLLAVPTGKKSEFTPIPALVPANDSKAATQPNSTTPLANPDGKKAGSVNNLAPSATNQPTATPAKKTGTASNSQTISEQIAILLKLKEKRVYVYQGEKLVADYPVAIGKKGWETPLGEWQVMEKVKNPGWTSFKDGSVLPPGPKNPLGERWIGFWTDGKDVIGFHGTPDLKSIGTAASHGCVRMRNRDVKALYPLVKVGTTVKVIDQ